MSFPFKTYFLKLYEHFIHMCATLNHKGLTFGRYVNLSLLGTTLKKNHFNLQSLPNSSFVLNGRNYICGNCGL